MCEAGSSTCTNTMVVDLQPRHELLAYHGGGFHVCISARPQIERNFPRPACSRAARAAELLLVHTTAIPDHLSRRWSVRPRLLRSMERVVLRSPASAQQFFARATSSSQSRAAPSTALLRRHRWRCRHIHNRDARRPVWRRPDAHSTHQTHSPFPNASSVICCKARAKTDEIVAQEMAASFFPHHSPSSSLPSSLFSATSSEPSSSLTSES